MTFSSQRRNLLAWLALATPWPLGFNQTLEWPWVLGFALAALFALRWNSAQGRASLLPNWGANVLGLAYLAFLWLDLTALSRGQVVRCMTHALVFALALRLFRIERERDGWSTLVGIFILFLAAMGTSTHPSIVGFLVAWLALAILVLTRFATFHLFAEFGVRDAPSPPLNLRGLSVLMALASTVLAVPLWIALPRLSTPVVAAAGSGGGVSVPLAMLTDEVTLDAIGALRGNRSVALRAVFEPPPDEREEIRFKAGAFDRFEDGRWRPSPSWESRAVDWERRLVLSSIPGTGRVRVWRSDLGIPVLPLPLGTVAVQVSAPQVRVSAGGTLSLDGGRNAALEYELDRVLEPVPLARDLTERDRGILTKAELSEEAQAIGRRAMGAGSILERVRRLETYLAENYEYSTVAVARPANREVEDFLLRERRGYCEYFASAMVLLLRAEGIPARLVSGFLGAEYSALGDQYVVRQENAHAWVEAWIEGQGWRTFDPTPVAGQPGIRRTSGAANLVAQAWEELVYRWDRYVLGYGYDEQRTAVFGWLRRFLSWRERARSERAAAQAIADAGPIASSASAPGDGGWWRSAAWPVLALLLATGALVLRRRGRRDATWAYLEARRLVARAGVELADARGPQAFRDLVLSRWPDVAGGAEIDARRELAALVDDYLGESFGRPGSSLLPAAEWGRRVAALRRGLSRRSRAGSRGATSSTGS